jgi:hypothetical protein
MPPQKRTLLSLLTIIGLLLLASLACNSPVSEAPSEPVPVPEGPGEVADQPGEEIDLDDEDIQGLEPDDPAALEIPPIPTADPSRFPDKPDPIPEVPIDQELLEELFLSEPSSEEMPPEMGMTRDKPYPTHTLVSTDNWDFQVRKVLRGEPAWQVVQADNPEHPAPPSGYEYLLIWMEVRCLIDDAKYHDFSITEVYVTGDHYRRYMDVLIDAPLPEFFYRDIFTAEVMETWIDVLVPVDEGNLLLVFDKTDYIEGSDSVETLRFVALEEGAAVQIPPELADIPPNQVGIDPANPAPIGVQVISEDWEITMLESIRGEAAMNMINEEANQREPEEGLEYIVFKFQLRNISQQDGLWNLSFANFVTYVGDGEHIDTPRVNYYKPSVYNWINEGFYPGGTFEGWGILAVPIGSTEPIAIFNPELNQGGDWTDLNTRYLKLTP